MLLLLWVVRLFFWIGLLFWIEWIFFRIWWMLGVFEFGLSSWLVRLGLILLVVLIVGVVLIVWCGFFVFWFCGLGWKCLLMEDRRFLKGFLVGLCVVVFLIVRLLLNRLLLKLLLNNFVLVLVCWCGWFEMVVFEMMGVVVVLVEMFSLFRCLVICISVCCRVLNVCWFCCLLECVSFLSVCRFEVRFEIVEILVWEMFLLFCWLVKLWI